MRWLVSLSVVTLVLALAALAHADDSEDLQFADRLFARKWYDWAGQVAQGLADKPGATVELRQQAAILHVQILRTQAIATGDETLNDLADAAQKRYGRLIPEGGALDLEMLKLKLNRAESLARRAGIEPDEKKRLKLKAQAAGIFEDVGKDFEKFIKGARLAVAKYPSNWPALLNRRPQLREPLLSAVWKRDYAEFLYANSFVPYSKVVAPGKKDKLVKRGLKKFLRFIEGEKEHAGDFDPPAADQKGPQEPDPRYVFRMLDYRAGIGFGQCYLELGRYDKAIEYFDYMVQAEVPGGSEESEEDIGRIVDIRLRAYYLEGYAYNKSGRPRLAEKILREMFDQSGKEIQPDRPAILAHWKKLKREEVALMPDIRENVFGKLAAFQLAKALAAQKRYSEGIEEVYRIFRIERERSTTGKAGPLEVEAAKTMAALSQQVSAVEFPIGAQFALAKGFYYQQQWSDAIYHFKKVYGSPGTPQEVREYAPEALFELGKLLYSGERYLEAGVAFAEICSKFRDFARLDRVIALLKQSLRRARDVAIKQGAGGEFEKAVLEKLLKMIPRDDRVPVLPDVSEFEGNYAAIIQAFEQVPKTYETTGEEGRRVTRPVPFYAYARAQIGYYRFMLYVKCKDSDSRTAAELLEQAIRTLREALKEAPALEDTRAELMARYYLGKCLVEDVYRGTRIKDNAREALKLLAPFRDRFKDSKTAQVYMPDVLATIAVASFKLENYDGMHAAFKELEKGYKDTRVFRNTCLRLYHLMKEAGDREAVKNTTLTESCYKKAAYYLYTLFTAAGNDLSPGELLGVGNALYETKSFKNAIEVLDKFLAALPAPVRRSAEERKQATTAKILLAEARYGDGQYKAAAGLFDILRRTAACPKCGYEKVLKPHEFDKLLPACPTCKKKGARLVKVHEDSLQIQEGAARSYLGAYEKLGRTDMAALNKAQDIYQRIHQRLQKSGAEQKQPVRFWEVRYIILKIWRYKREFGRIVGTVRNWILFSRPNANPKKPAEADWKAAIPVQPWRDEIRKLYYASLTAFENK